MSGALGSLCDLARAVTDTLNDGLSLMETRLRLMSLELQEEKGRIVGLLVWTALSVLFAMLAIVMVTFTVVYLLEGRQRVVALILFAVFYSLAAVVSGLVIRKKLLSTRPFSQTLEEFKKDRGCF